MKKQSKPSKLRNVKTAMGGLVFDSKKEANRYAELKLLERSGVISCLELQKTFELIPVQKIRPGKTERACNYRADFVYKDKNGNVVVEDVKGYKKGTAYNIFVMKRKFMWFFHKIEVIEV